MRASRHTQARRVDLRPTVDSTQTLFREGQTVAGESLLVRYVNFVRLPHTIFALPFALLGVVYASSHAPVTARQIGLVVLAFTAARFAAMGFNRLVDRDVDAKNPRTAGREIPAGRLSVRAAALAVAAAGALFVGAAALLNPLCLALSPLALAWILAYSYTKRYTSWSHAWLGASLAMAPAGGFLAITGSWSHPVWTLHALAAGVLVWVAGFDIFYALQDEAFDRAHRLRSAVVRLGRRRAIAVAKGAHGATIALLVLFGVGAGFGLAYFTAVILAAGLLIWEHRLVRPDNLDRLDAAFFTMNGVMSIVVFVGALVDRIT